MNFDSMIFGNGLSLNFLKQIEPFIGIEKKYLLNIDEFLKAFIENRLSRKEENRIYNIRYKSKNIEDLKKFEIFKLELIKYYKVHDANIEYWLGVDIFKSNKCGYNYPLIKNIFPSLYNIWHEILIDYLIYLDYDCFLESFPISVHKILNESSNIYTTNFDRFFDALKPKHLHGTFVKGFKQHEELIFKYFDDINYYFKCIWGWNGLGKLNLIREISDINGSEKYFDFDFFFDKDFHINNILIYGLGFLTAGYMKDLSDINKNYKDPTFGGIIDEHILMRLKGLQTCGQLDYITFAYHSENDLINYKKISILYNLERVEFIKASSLLFSI